MAAKPKKPAAKKKPAAAAKKKPAAAAAKKKPAAAAKKKPAAAAKKKPAAASKKKPAAATAAAAKKKPAAATAAKKKPAARAAKAPAHRKAERFDFDEPRRARVLTCRRVTEGAPILLVAHDDDGDWQFLCDGVHDDLETDAPVVACLECTVADDPTLNEVADLHGAWSATRTKVGGPWERHDDIEDAIRDTVEEHGWFVAKVPEGETEAEPPFAYTIGLTKTFGHPELIIVGLRLETMHGILNLCGERLRAGEGLPVGKPFAGVLGEYNVVLRPVTDQKSFVEHVGYALWFHGKKDFELLQVVWPDKDGRFPGERGANPVMTTQQPLLP